MISRIPGRLDGILVDDLVALGDKVVICGTSVRVVVREGLVGPEVRQLGPLHNPPSTSRDKLTSINGGRVPAFEATEMGLVLVVVAVEP